MTKSYTTADLVVVFQHAAHQLRAEGNPAAADLADELSELAAALAEPGCDSMKERTTERRSHDTESTQREEHLNSQGE